MNFKIEVGKKYKTRCGGFWIAGAYNPNAHKSYRWVGWDENGVSVSLSDEGRYSVYSEQEDGVDLVAEHKETVKKYQVLYYSPARECWEVDDVYYTSINHFKYNWSAVDRSKPQLIMESVKEFEV